jgi:class 3 adenylate cyclase
MERLKQIAERLIIPASIAVLSTTLAILLTHNVAFLTQAERFVEDLRIATLLPPEPQDPNIVIAGITEDTLKLFPYRSPVDREFLANLLKALDAKHPRAIAMDVLLDQATEPEKDALLKETIANLQTPLVISYTANPEIVDKKQLAFLNAFVPPQDRVAAEIASDTFGTARWILPEVVQPDGTHMLAFARGLLAKGGVETPDTQPEMAWHGRPNAETPPFKMFPSQLVKMLPEAWIKDKYVLVGEVVSLTDRHRTPFAAVYSGNDGSLPGIEVHANAVAQLLEHQPQRILGPTSEVALVLLMAIVGAGLGALPVPVYQRIALGFGSFALLWAVGFALFRWIGVSIVLISPSIAGALAQWGTDLVTGRQLRRQREFIQGAFGRFVSPAVVAKLVADPEKLALEGEAREMTFIFTDIEGFTTLSEELAQREKAEGTHLLAPMLNAYLDGVCAAILRHEGTIDKFIGDAVMVIFNAPADQPDHAERAVRCALAIDAYSEEFRAGQHAKNIRLGKTRLGIHTGTAMVGNFGAHNKMQYTALGDTVNTASRLEGVNKYFGTRICVSETTRTHVADVPFRPIGEIAVKGKAEMFEIFEPLDETRANSSYVMRYNEAYQLAKDGDPKAVKVFEELMNEAPDDKCVALLYEQMRESNVVGVGMVMHDK